MINIRSGFSKNLSQIEGLCNNYQEEGMKNEKRGCTI